MNWTQIRKQFGNRSAIIGAGVAGFVIGAGGLVAAQIDNSPAAEVEVEVEVETENTVADTVADTVPTSSVSPTSVDLTLPVNTVDDSTDDTAPDNTIDDDSTSSSAPDNTIDDDSTSSSAPDNTIDDDSTSSSAPDNTIDDDSTSSSVPDNTTPAAPPAPFSRTYQSAGGSIDVTWTGTEFVLNAVSPAGGFTAEIEDQRWDRIRVDFDSDDGDTRIEVKLSDDVPGGQVRVRID